jgi:multiple sugar transport system ATP-binding protein
LHDRIRATTVYVTHDQTEAMAMADRIAVMNHGVVVQIGSPQDIYDRPADMHVAGFIGSPPMSFLKFKSSLTPGQTSVQLNGEAIRVPALRQGVVEGELALGVRPEHVRISDLGEMRGEVFSVEYMGTMQIVTINTKHGQLTARISSRQRVRVGETVGLTFDSERLVVFDAVSGSALKSRLFEGSASG